MVEGPGADSEEKHEPVSDIDTAVVDSLIVLDPEWPIREADIPGVPAVTSEKCEERKSSSNILDGE